ncbi:MAG TPA: polysaccharide deacetylase family protein [Bacillota bacterium]|nr:polysaccharide deacetylase family protein [Bacillota bacterium]
MFRLIGFTILFLFLFTGNSRGEDLALNQEAIPVLIYHSISTPTEKVPDPKLYVSAQRFEEQLTTITRKGYTPITVREWMDGIQRKEILPKKPIIITFDDGYEDNYQFAYPILKKHHAKATIFVITEVIGQQKRFMTWEQLSEMQSSGCIDIESHTVHHLPLAQLPQEQAKEELLASKKQLEMGLNKKVYAVAYPFGSHTEKIKELAKDAGYKLAFSTHPGYAKLSQGLFDLRRILVKTSTNFNTFLK